MTFIEPTRRRPCRVCGLCDFWDPFFKLEERAFKFEDKEAAAAAAAAPLPLTFPLMELGFVLLVLRMLALLLFLLLAVLPVCAALFDDLACFFEFPAFDRPSFPLFLAFPLPLPLLFGRDFSGLLLSPEEAPEAFLLASR